MNHAYRVVFNHTRGVWQAVAETARAHGNGGRGAVALATVAVLGTLSTAAWADNLLVGSGSINGGNGGNDYYVGGSGGGGIGGTTVTVASPATNTDIGASYDYVVIGSGGGGGWGDLYGNPGGSGHVGTPGTPGELSLSGFTLSVANDLRVGGFGGGGGGWGGLAEQGGQGGAGTLTLGSGSTVTVAGQTVLGGGGGIGGAAAGSGPGGAGGAGTLNLGGGSTLNANGGFVINVGSTLNIGNATPNAATAGTLAGVTGFTNNGAINFNQSNTTTFAAAIAGIGTVTQNSGTTTLTGANTYTGTTTVNGGTLTFAGAGTLGATSIGNVVVNAGTLDLGGTTQTKNTTITLAGGVIGNGTLSSAGLFDMQAGSASAVLAGTAALAKSGAGTVTLSGINTYTGATGVNVGTLALAGSGVIAGSSGVTIAAGAGFDISATTAGASIQNLNGAGGVTLGGKTLTVTNAGTFSGVIAGSGGLTKTGAGTLTLSGANVYTGTTTLSAGTLALSGAGTLGATSTGNVVVNAGTLDLGGTTQTKNTTITLAGGAIGNGTLSSAGLFDMQSGSASAVLAGTAALAKSGAGTVTLTGTNTYTGGTLLNGGTLAVASDANLGNAAGALAFDGGALQNTAAFASNRTVTLGSGSGTFQANADLALSGVISGSGGLTKTGVGTLTLTGANTYAGATTIAAGTLKVGAGGTAGSLGTGAVTDDGVLAFERSDDVTVNNTISGSGVLNQLGAGKLILESSANTLGGGVNVNAGTLIVGGSTGSTAALTANVNVASGATLGGHGAIGGNVAVATGATLSPGNSIGTLTLGSLALASGANWRVELRDGGNTPGVHNDFVHVTGAASIANGVTIHATPENGTDNGSTYAANTRYTLLTADGGLTVSGSQVITDDYAYLNFTGGFDANNYYLTSALTATSFCLPGQTKNQCATGNGAFALGPGNPVYDALLNLNAAASGPALDQLSGVEHAYVPLLAFMATRRFQQFLGERTGGRRDAANPARDGFWMRAQGADGRIDGDGNASGAKHNGGGFALGADRWLRDDLLFGLAAGYGHDQADTATGDVDVASYQIAAYGRWQPAAYYLDASLGYGHHRSDVTRHIGFLGLRADDDYSGNSANLALEAGWPLARGQATLTPYAGLSAAWWRRDNSAESGAGAANLELATQTVDSQRSHLGLRYTWNGMRFAPTADVAWVHEFGDTRMPVDARFASFTPATDFRIHGPELDRDRLALSFGLTVWADKNARLSVGYRGEFAESDREHAATAALRWTW